MLDFLAGHARFLGAIVQAGEPTMRENTNYNHNYRSKAEISEFLWPSKRELAFFRRLLQKQSHAVITNSF